MKTNIKIVTTILKAEADDYRKKYDEIMKAKNRELKELRENYKQGTELYRQKENDIKTACDKTISKLRVEAATSLDDVEELRKQERERVQTVNETILNKIKVIDNLPITALELTSFAEKINAKGDYWACRAISNLAEKNGIDATELGIESTFDVKMSVLDQLTEQFEKVISLYPADDNIEERANTRFLYLNDDIIKNAVEIYGGKLGVLSDEEKADKAFLNVIAQQTQMAKGIAISNALSNAKGEVKNILLCKLSEDGSISNVATEISGHASDIADFKNGKATEYRKAVSTMEYIRTTKDKSLIEMRLKENEENSFLPDMIVKEKQNNPAFAELMTE